MSLASNAQVEGRFIPHHIQRKPGAKRPWLLLATVGVFVFDGLQAAPLVAPTVPSSTANSAASGTGASSLNAPIAAAAQNTQKNLAISAPTLQSLASIQAAARAAASAVAAPNNLGADPNHPGNTLPNVPDGLGVGGLNPDPAHPWTGANAPTQTSTTTSGITSILVTINQTQQTALLYWLTFNIGKNTTLSFLQGGADWVAINRVLDPSGVPSQILGSIKAPGAVFAINQNGIIFGGSSQVNAGALIVSSLPINTNLAKPGHALLDNPDSQFLFSSLPIAALPGGAMAPFNPASDPISTPPLGYSGDITIQPGASLNTIGAGGYVALIGPNVTNAGSITTSDGQAILAAGQQVGLAAHSNADASLRGLDVFIGAVTDPSSPNTGGVAINSGLIQAFRGDITMAGKDVEQNGGIISSTSVNYNGRFDLLANYQSVASQTPLPSTFFTPTQTGTITLGPGSLSQILPEWTSHGTVDAAGAGKFLPSMVVIQGQTIHLAGLSTILAPGATVALQAGNWYQTITIPANSPYSFFSTLGRVNLDAGSVIDVSGSQNIADSVGRFFVGAELRSAELADSPLQQNGFLYQKTVDVDMRNNGQYNGRDWVGSPIGNLFGQMEGIQSNIGELTAGGGSVTISAGGSVGMQPGSSINVSGGWVNYQGASVQTSQLLSGNVAVNISQATPDRLYTGLSQVSHYEPGYVQGANAGTLAITAPAMTLNGDLYGAVMTGPNQRMSAGAVSANILSVTHGIYLNAPSDSTAALDGAADRIVRQTWGLPTAGALSLSFHGKDPLYLTPFYTGSYSSPAPQTMYIEPVGLAPAGAFDLNPDFFNRNGFGQLLVDNSDGDIVLPAGMALNGRPGGALSLTGANVKIYGNITLPGGTVTLKADDQTWLNAFNDGNNIAPASYDNSRGQIVLGTTASASAINTAGLIVDDRSSSSSALTLPFQTGGGNMAISGISVSLASGSSLDVSGGAAIGANGKVAYGNGGNLSILAGRDPVVADLVFDNYTLANRNRIGYLGWGAALKGYSGSLGGSLTLEAPFIQVDPTTAAAWSDGATPSTLHLSPGFFSEGGFNSFTIQGVGKDINQTGPPAVRMASGANVAPVVQSYQTALDGSAGLVPVQLPSGLRPPVSLEFDASGAVTSTTTPIQLIQGDVVMEKGSSITTDPAYPSPGSVTLKGDTVTMLGSITDPGGKISVKGSSSTAFYSGISTVDIGQGAALSVAGTTVLTPNALGYRTGKVLDGGTINVSGNIFAETSSTLDVSGASGALDLAPGSSAVNVNPGVVASPFLGGQTWVPTQVDSNGGTITLGNGNLLVMESTLRGHAGGPSAQGGGLTLASGSGIPNTPLKWYVNFYLAEAVSGLPVAIPGSGVFYNGSFVGSVWPSVNGNPFPGFFAGGTLDGSGLDSLTIKGNVQYSGNVTLTANRSLNIASGGVLSADPTAASDITLTLNAPDVTIGQGLLSPQQTSSQGVSTQQSISILGLGNNILPAYGKGVVKVGLSSLPGVSDPGNRVQLIEVGNLSMQNVKETDLTTVSGGEIRGSGTLDASGTINLAAGQIDPLTDAIFNLAAYPSTGSSGAINIFASGTPGSLPLSAGGQLNFYASSITQGGALRAPIGAINLGGGSTPPADPWNVTLGSIGYFPATASVTLLSGSETSVSAVDPSTGQGILLPYGTVVNGLQWFDPSGMDITGGGLPSKVVKLSATTVTVAPNARIDLRGGGDLYASQFVAGLKGSYPILDYAADPTTGFTGSKSYAVLPGFTGFAGDLGFSGSASAPAVGDKVHLAASQGLAEGDYTLLPANDALLPGTFLVTPLSGSPLGVSPLQPDGSTQVSGYRFNSLNSARSGQTAISLFEVAPSGVVAKRAEYDLFSANAWLKASALSSGLTPPRLPMDGGQLIAIASQNLQFQGSFVPQQFSTGGLSSLMDMATSAKILIAAPGVTGNPGDTVISSADLDHLNVGSLLMGGYRTAGSNGLSVTTLANDLEVDGSVQGANSLTAGDIILVANNSLKLDPGVSIQSVPLSSPSPTLTFSGGALVRVSGSHSASVVRQGSPGNSSLFVGSGVGLNGTSIILDSSQTAFDPSAALKGINVTLNSGQISLQLNNAGSLLPTTGLVLSQSAFNGLLANAQALSLSSYSSIDIYGNGQIGQFDSSSGLFSIQSLGLHAGEIRGFNNGSGAVTIQAGNLFLDNALTGTVPGIVSPPSPLSVLTLQAGTLTLGANTVAIDQYAQVNLTAENGVLFKGIGGVSISGAATVTTPLITGATGAPSQTMTSTGTLTLAKGGSAPISAGGLGAILNLKGSGISDSSNIVLPSGQATLEATSGNLIVNGQINVGGVEKSYYDMAQYTDGGQVTLISDTGSVAIGAGAQVSVAAAAGGGNGGTLTIQSPNGSFSNLGTLSGQGGNVSEASGVFSLDVGSLPLDANNLHSLGGINAQLDAAGFNQSRSFRDRTDAIVTINGSAMAQQSRMGNARSFTVSADQGAMDVTGNIDVSGQTGGKIALFANGGVTLEGTASVTVAGNLLDAAGKAGLVDLETQGANGGVIDIQTGSTLDFSVGGGAGGVLYLRAPQVAGGTDVAINPINGTLVNPSSIAVEGYKTYAATTIDSQEAAVLSDANTFGANAGTIQNRLLANNAVLASVAHIRPGAEIDNFSGDLTLGSDWDLSTYRFNGEPGTLTLRASGNLIFNGSLNDGFSNNGLSIPLYQWTTMTGPSWSYRLVAGADSSAADFHQVSGSGSLKLGKNFTNPTVSPFFALRKNLSNVTGYSTTFLQTIRTGTGDIDISSGGDVLLLNQFATIYTAGSQVSNPTYLNGSATPNFDLPATSIWVVPSTLSGVKGYEVWNGSHLYPAQYTQGGGNVTIQAKGDIAHETLFNGSLVMDSELQLPINWLYRRGQVGTNGQFATGRFGDAMSTAWWVSFMSFFEGVGALGGGDVTLTAGQDIYNVDAAIPTNARMPKGTPDASQLVELGGGNLLVKAGRDINGGVYYVESGHGTLEAGNQVTTNPRRQASIGAMIRNSSGDSLATIQSELPTTLFAGKSSFDVSARGDLNIGPIANVFLLPEGLSNQVWYKTAFSTFSPNAGLTLSSLTGTITLRQADSNQGLLLDYITHALLTELTDTAGFYSSAAYLQPWLRTDDTSIAAFSTALDLTAPSLSAAALGGDIRLVTVDGFNLSPSSTGTVNLFADGNIIGLNSLGNDLLGDNIWSAGRILLSDSDPARIYSPATPFSIAVPPRSDPPGFRSLYAKPVNWNTSNFAGLFGDDGSPSQTLTQQQENHDSNGLLHAGDTSPARIYALNGDISGFSLFSPKATEVSAGRDITDIAIYAQNLNSGDLSVISAGRDIVPFDPTSPLRQQMVAATGGLASNQLGGLPTQIGEAGDLQIGGPGALEVLAGRKLDLGQNIDSTRASENLGLGITSIGNARNPLLPNNVGAQVITGAGLGALNTDGSVALAGQQVDFSSFKSAFLDPVTIGNDSVRYLPILGAAMKSLKPDLVMTSGQIWSFYQNKGPGQTAGQMFTSDEQNQLALGVFYLALRDAGTLGASYSDSSSALAALKTIFSNPNTPVAIQNQYTSLLLNAMKAQKPDFAILTASPSWTDSQAWIYYQNQGPDQTAGQMFTSGEQAQIALGIFPFVLPTATGQFGLNDGYKAIQALYPGSQTAAAGSSMGKSWAGDLSLTFRQIATKQGGSVTLFAPGGALNVGLNSASGQGSSDQSKKGILTEHGGDISIFTRDDVNVGTSRIFTLYGGNVNIWSSLGNIDAGNSSKTVQAAPPTSVFVNPVSMRVEIDPSGVATGGGIGVLESIPGTPPSDVALIAPSGIVNAGDAGVRVSGNLTISALAVLNANNIQAAGSSSGIPTSTPAASSAPTVSVSSAAAKPASGDDSLKSREPPSDIFSVEVIGFGDEDPSHEFKKKKKAATVEQSTEKSTEKQTPSV